MAEIINLRRARKAKGRADKAVDAAANRAAHGRTKAERELARAREARVSAVLDGARREPADRPAPSDREP
jgi:hypothetical protein